jgi:hypothetical protein
MHRRGVNHPPASHLAGVGGHSIAEGDRGELVAVALDRGAAGTRDRARDAAAVAQLGVGRVGDRVDLERGDVRGDDLDRSDAAIVDDRPCGVEPGSAGESRACGALKLT